MQRKKIVTENPEGMLWWHLRQYKNVERVAPLLRERHTTKENARKQARQIRYCIEQAEEYFLSARQVSLATKPLQLYYGMASLAWALILFKKTGDYALDRLGPKHREHGLLRPSFEYGIRNLPLNTILEKIDVNVPSQIEGSQKELELPGTFGLLYSVIGYEFAWVQLHSSQGGLISTTSVPVQRTNPPPSMASLAGSRLSLAQLLLPIPDLAASFAELGIRPPWATITDFKIRRESEGGTYGLAIATSENTPKEVEELRARFENLPGVRFHEAPTGIAFTVPVPQDELIPMPYLGETVDGRHFFYIGERPGPVSEPLPETSVFLASFFMLGMLVRYYPHIWIQMLDRRHPIAELIEAFIPLAERKYQNLILNNLSGDYYVFSRG